VFGSIANRTSTISCIPTRASKPPVGPQWIHEIKHLTYTCAFAVHVEDAENHEAPEAAVVAERHMCAISSGSVPGREVKVIILESCDDKGALELSLFARVGGDVAFVIAPDFRDIGPQEPGLIA
jgi:hypothetical protein